MSRDFVYAWGFLPPRWVPMPMWCRRDAWRRVTAPVVSSCRGGCASARRGLWGWLWRVRCRRGGEPRLGRRGDTVGPEGGRTALGLGARMRSPGARSARWANTARIPLQWTWPAMTAGPTRPGRETLCPNPRSWPGSGRRGAVRREAESCQAPFDGSPSPARAEGVSGRSGLGTRRPNSGCSVVLRLTDGRES